MKAKNKKRLLMALTIVYILFIFSNSLDNGSESQTKSEFVRYMVNTLIAIINIGAETSGLFIRKIAHFCEYALLGMLVALNFKLYFNGVYKERFRLLLIGVFIPLIDETIQLFVPGRSGQITDVWIDFLGFIMGMTCILLLLRIIEYINKKREYKAITE